MNQVYNRISKLFGQKKLYTKPWFRAAQGLIIFAVLFLTVSVGILPPQYTLEVGEISPETIYAPRTVIDHAATSIARYNAAEAVPDIYIEEPSVTEMVVNEVTVLLQYLLDIDRTEFEEDEGKEEFVQHLLEQFPEIGVDTVNSLIAIEVDRLEEVIEHVTNLIHARMHGGIKESEVEANQQQLLNEIYQAQFGPVLSAILSSSIEEHFTFNMFKSDEATENERRRARDQVEEIRILKGAKIVDRGESVTVEHISQLQALGLLHTSFAYGYYLGLAGLLLCVYAVWGYYLFKLRPDLFANPSRLWLIGVIIILTLAFAKFFGTILEFPYLIPASMATLLLTIIFDVNLALFFGTSLSLVIAVMTGNEMSVLIVALVGSVVGAYSVTQVNQRSDLTRAGVYIAGANAIVILGLILTGDGMAMTSSSIQRTLIDMAMGVGSGILASVFATGLLPFFEIAFGITTSVRLLELANPNQKPLKRLLLEAPGTYHHSILVGNLAEAAAEVVGADPVLARVGAYYHDLGKLTRPYFFIENQFQGSNPHDKIPPSLSSMILTAHVKAGVELANQYKLPPVIKDIIQQHHGDTLIGFFYHRALSERGNKDQLLEDKFRYEGPKPQFKEAGIIMLADCVEAAVRSLAQPNQFRIQSMITKIVQDKLADGQLDECDLTLKDLNMISEAFVRVITGIYHKRIAYPTEQDLAKIGS